MIRASSEIVASATERVKGAENSLSGSVVNVPKAVDHGVHHADLSTTSTVACATAFALRRAPRANSARHLEPCSGGHKRGDCHIAEPGAAPVTRRHSLGPPRTLIESRTTSVAYDVLGRKTSKKLAPPTPLDATAEMNFEVTV